MASEIQYVTCQELYNPSFIPQAPSTEDTHFLKDGNLQLETVSDSNGEVMPVAVDLLPAEEGLERHVSQSTTGFKCQGSASPDNKTELSYLENGTDIEHISPLVMMFPAEEELPHAGKQYDTATQIQSVIIRPPSPPVTSPNWQSLQENSLHHETLLVEGTNASTVDDRPQISVPDIHTEHTSDTCGSESTQRHDNPITSDQVDDEVQFILSVARKKRKKRARLDPQPGENSQRSKGPSEKDNCEHAMHRAHQNERLNLQAAFLETAGFQDVIYKLPGMNHASDGSPVQLTSTGSLKFPDSSSAAPTCKPRDKAKRKDREGQSHNLPEDLPVTTASAVKNGYPLMGTPLLHQHQHLSQSLSMEPLTRMQDMPRINPASAGQPNCKIETHIPLSHGQQSPQANASSTQSHVYWPVRPAPYLNQVQCVPPSITESLQRRPSLYGIPQWHASPLDRGMALPTTSASGARSLYQSHYGFKNGDLNGAPQIHSNGPGNGTVSLPGGSTYGKFPSGTVFTQPLSIQKPEAPLAGVQNLQSKHPRNMLVDIAQTCQDNFPFALIAKRHNQPIQKVFDTFSAVIQLPLLRSAGDARRPGKLGSFRMKEFNALKKNAKQLQKEKQARKQCKNVEGNGNTSS